MIYLIKNGEVYAPDYIGKKDIMVAGEKIELIQDEINLLGIEHMIIDASDSYIVPGLIDSHVHICGGGGEGGYSTRTPEIKLTDLTTSGVTTVVGVLGTDGTTRTMTNLIAKANSLSEEGVSAYVYTGSYQIPVRTITGSITDDIILLDKVIGVGELALSDHRSSVPTLAEFTRVVADARLGGMLSGKAGIINIHMGDKTNPMELIYEMLETTTIPITQLLPTHMNRNPWLFEEAIKYTKSGGYVDFTTSTVKQFIDEGEVPASEAVKRLLDEGCNIENITLSSDGQGSLPVFDTNGNLNGITLGTSLSILESIRDMVKNKKIPLEVAMKTVTSNPAKILKLSKKGNIKPYFDADICILNKNDLNIKYLLSMGQLMINNGQIIVKGTFE